MTGIVIEGIDLSRTSSASILRLDFQRCASNASVDNENMSSPTRINTTMVLLITKINSYDTGYVNITSKYYEVDKFKHIDFRK